MEHPGVARVVIGLGAMVALAVLATHPKVRAIEERLGITVLASAGIPFLVLGYVFSLPAVAVLTPKILLDLRPAFEFGMGWVGFIVGMQFDVRRMDLLPQKTGQIIAYECITPIVTTFLLTSVVLVMLAGGNWRDLSFAREALVLAGCAAPSAPLALGALIPKVGAKAAGLTKSITDLDEIIAFALLGVVTVLYRPEGGAVAWLLPRSAWLLMLFGLGGTLGIVTYILLRGAHGMNEKLSLLLGAIALTSGMAGYLALSPAVVAALAGALLVNLPLGDAPMIRKLLDEVERPLHLVFLVIVGAEWRPDEWQGWALAVVFVLGRLVGKRSGSAWASAAEPNALPARRPLFLALLPQSPNSIVVMVSAATLYHFEKTPSIRWSINAVILGAVFSEILLRLLDRPSPAPAQEYA